MNKLSKSILTFIGIATLVLVQSANAEHIFIESESKGFNGECYIADNIGHYYQATVLFALQLYNTRNELKGKETIPYKGTSESLKELGQRIKEELFNYFRKKKRCQNEDEKREEEHLYRLKLDLFEESFLSSIDVNPKDNMITPKEINQFRKDNGLKPIEYKYFLLDYSPTK